MKRPELPFLQVKTVKGREYCYFRRNGGYLALPHYSDPDFFRAYEDAIQGRQLKPSKNTFRRLIQEYQASPKFRNLKPRTKKDYAKVDQYLLDVVADDDPARMIRRDVVDAQMANTHRARFANEIVAQLSRLFEFGINLGWLDHNPAKGVERLKTGEGHKPWPKWLIAAYRAAANGADLVFFELCLGTGQRVQDVLDMKWADIEDGGINVTQKKTGHELWVPFTPRLSNVLSTTPRSGFWIVSGKHGRALSYNSIEQRFRKIRADIGGEDYVMHGLRYTAAHELAAAGCTDAEIAAITGHKSVEMVAKYSRKAGQRGLALRAQEKRK